MDHDDPFAYYFDPFVALDFVRNVATSLQNRAAESDWLWTHIRNDVIDAVTRTVALGFLASVAAASIYIAISRKWRDGGGALILISILPDCLVTFGVWLGFLSRLAHMYSKMYMSLADTRSLVDSIPACIDSHRCTDLYSVKRPKPPYTSHGCVGTVLMAADPMMQATVVCGVGALWLYQQNRLGLLSGAYLLVPLVAAYVSAANHVKGVCWPEPIVLDNGLRITPEWEMFSPKGLDPVSARLALFVRVLPMLPLLQDFWLKRQALKARIGNEGRRWAYWFAVTYMLPIFVNEGWRSLRNTYVAAEPMTSWPMFKYAIFSAGDAFLPPFMAIYPGLALLVQRIRWENWESRNKREAGAESTSLQEKEKAEATLGPVAATSDPDAKVIDSEVASSDI